jgi:voltage-gated potassium channel Kch
VPITLRQRLRYRFDNLMAKGVGAQIAVLAVAALGLILIAATLLVLVGVAPENDAGEKPSFGRLVWGGLMHTLDAGAVGGDAGSWTFLFIMLGITIGGIFVLSALIGILTGGFGEMIQNLRKGRSLVIERDHTVILGWNSKIEALLGELAQANENRPGAALVILAGRDKVEMDDAVREFLADRRLRVVTRHGSPLAIADLRLTNLSAARAIIVLAPETDHDGAALAAHDADTTVLKTLLAVVKAAGPGGPHIVAEVHSDKTLAVARMVVGDRAALVHTPPLISRLLVQTGRQSGLSAVHTELLSFDGDEIYMQAEPRLTGKSFREVVSAYDDSAVLGVLTAAGEVLLPPPFERPMGEGDRVIAVSRDDDTVVPNGKGPHFDAEALAPARPLMPLAAERTLVLGDSVRLGLVLAELDAYVAPGSETLVVGEDESAEARVSAAHRFSHMRTRYRAGDVTDRQVLDGLDVTGFDHVLVLSETAGRSQDLADARTMITLLHLRDLMRRAKKTVPVTSEILDVESRELAAVAEADDFIVSNTLVSLVLAQLAENRHLGAVFDELLAQEGNEIYLKPAPSYVQPGVEVDFYTVVEAAARRGEVALGYRRMSDAIAADAHYGVRLNPVKSQRIKLGADDRVIVLARDAAT